jgi:LCP family protein required for cell wall assembly
MILFTIDPLSKTAGMLSIPRDLWVRIPNFDYGKINTAYQLGEAWNLPGGGPELARETAENLIGVPIQYYAQIDFSAFIRFIDEIGGVKIDNPKKIKIDLLDDKEGNKKIISSGIQTLSGEYALAYVRARNSEGGDFDRALRQQLVIIGIRDRITHYSLLPTLLSKAPVLYGEISSGVNTNLSLDEAFQLAVLAQQIPDENIFKGSIGAEHVAFAKSPDGLDILKPLPDKIRVLRDQIFNSNEIFSPVVTEGDNPLDLVLAENASIKILNGTFTPGLAGRTSEYFQSLELNVQQIADAENKPQPYTSIYDYTGNPYALKYFIELMGISEFRVFQRFSPESEVDVAIIIGDDWLWNNPMP